MRTRQEQCKEHNAIVENIIEEGFASGMGGGVKDRVYKGWVLCELLYRVNSPELITAAMATGLTQDPRTNLQRGAVAVWDRAIKCLKQYKVTGNVITRRGTA